SEGAPDEQLSATVHDLYEDSAPAEAQRMWNGGSSDCRYPQSTQQQQSRPYRRDSGQGHAGYCGDGQSQSQSQAYIRSLEQNAGMDRGRMPSVHSTSGYGMYEPRAAGPSAADGLGRQAQTVECPWCHAVVTTRIKRRIGFKAGGAAVLVAAIAWPLFWVPLVVPGLHRKTHYCPQCRRKIGRGRRSGVF
ncbi:hypothetical protein GGF37_004474, partial [Kickxella alabastrina]